MPAIDEVLTIAPPPALRQHLRDLVLHAHEDAGQVDRQHAVERLAAEFMGALSGRADRAAADAGVVERAIEPAEGRDRARDHRLHVGFARTSPPMAIA